MSIIIKFNMNFDNFQRNIFNSSITIITVKPSSNQNDDIGFFDNHADSNDLLDRNTLKQFKGFGFENQSLLQGSFFDPILPHTCKHSDKEFVQLATWVRSSDEIGCSQDQQFSQQIQILPRISEGQKHFRKHKTIQKLKQLESSEDNFNLNQSKRIARKFQNQTKNLPKNYGKAILAFAIKNFKKFQHFPEFKEIRFQDFKKALVEKRQTMNSIAGLKSIWVDFKYAKCMRMLSNLFLRGHSLSYVFNSKISNISPHIKYRYRLLEAIKTPTSFNLIKEF